jgi:hypothetical protein
MDCTTCMWENHVAGPCDMCADYSEWEESESADPIQHPAVVAALAQARAAGVEEGRRMERAAVVEWFYSDHCTDLLGNLTYMSQAIESGAHLPEPEDQS